ncbi:M10 family metallopeptidase C-terminal domain-containing protein [Paracoccaceae bacterium]|nr:M10 family metallopeptidase C-terminal domain-containing protein [Paracoccaceae bacterium]
MARSLNELHQTAALEPEDCLDNNPLGTAPFADLSTLSAYLTQGFWTDFGTVGRKWNLTDTGLNAKSGEITYSLGSNWFDSDGINSNHATLTRYAFQYLENITGINFTETSDGSSADIAFGNEVTGSAYASTTNSSSIISRGFINIGPNWYANSPTDNDYLYQTILHEIGHVLGLGHQSNYNGSASFPTDADFSNDCWSNSIMSYFWQSKNTNIDASNAFLQSFMAVDVLALDELYGDQSYGGKTFGTSNAFTGDTTYGFNTTISASDDYALSNLSENADVNAFCIVDGAGNDTLDCSGWSVDQLINLTVTSTGDTTPTTSNIAGLTGNLSLAANTVIENAVGGSGDDIITGNQYSNYLNGGDGDDQLYGGDGDDFFDWNSSARGGADTFYGGAGNDHYMINSTSDRVFENANEGNDTVWVQASYFAGEYVENVNLLSNGNYNVYSSENFRTNNRFFGNSGNNLLMAYAGDDYLEGGGGNDSIYGGRGNDELRGGNGNDWLRGESGNDKLYASTGDDWYLGGDGEDILYVESREDISLNLTSVYGSMSGLGNATVKDIEKFAFGSGSDHAVGSSIGETFYGNNGNDKLYGGSGNDRLYGGSGNDTLQGDAGNDILNGGGGTDTIVFTGNAKANVNLASTRAQNTGHGRDTITGVENVTSGNGADTLRGNGAANTLIGNNGNDKLYGGSGNDRLYGGAGNDDLSGGAGNDRLYGGAGNDIIRQTGSGTQFYDGGAGNDTYALELENWRFPDNFIGEVDLQTGFSGVHTNHKHPLNDRVTNIENVTLKGDIDFIINGNATNNVLKAAGGNDKLYGNNGNDKLYGGSGNDRLYGGSGNDTLQGDAGNDILNGGGGTDTIVFTGNAKANVNLASTRAQNTGHGRDTITGVENVTSGNGADTLRGNGAANTLSGNKGNDKVYGNNGNDKLYGGSGNDRLYGGGGRDTIQGDSGKDTMFGGSSADTFIFTKTSDSSANASRADVIRDFTDGVDKINLRAIDASTDLSGNNTFTFDGTTSFGTSKQGDVYYKKFNKAGTANDYTMVYIDTDDDRATEMSIRLTGLFDLGADDFIL